MLPVLSASQDEPERVKSMLRRAITVSSYLVLPMMAGLIAVARPMVLLLLGEKWLPCVPFLQIMCIAYSFWPIHIANLQALNAMGRSDIFLKLEIVKKMVGLAVLVVGIRYNPLVLVALKAAADFLCTFINAWPNKRLLNYSILEQWKDIIRRWQSQSSWQRLSWPREICSRGMAGPGNADSLWRGCVYAGILGFGAGSVPVYQGPGNGQAARKKVNRRNVK